jgi:hypothetical protein
MTAGIQLTIIGILFFHMDNDTGNVPYDSAMHYVSKQTNLKKQKMLRRYVRQVHHRGDYSMKLVGDAEGIKYILGDEWYEFHKKNWIFGSDIPLELVPGDLQERAIDLNKIRAEKLKQIEEGVTFKAEDIDFDSDKEHDNDSEDDSYNEFDSSDDSESEDEVFKEAFPDDNTSKRKMQAKNEKPKKAKY